MRIAAPLLFLSFLLAACDFGYTSDFREEYVVESYQRAGAPLASVFVLRNTPVGEAFDRTALGVRDAEVEVQLLGEDGTVAARYPFRYVQGSADEYRSEDPEVTLQGLRRYRLEVRVPGFEKVISAETLVPGPFELVSSNADSLRYQDPVRQFIFQVTRSPYPGRQAIYNFTTETLLDAPTLDDVVPFVRSFLDRNDNGIIDGEEPGEDGITFEDLRISGSPLLNEANYAPGEGGTISIKLPWLALVFYGPNRIAANAVDDNLYDFLTTQSVQQGGSTYAPGEIPNVLDRVENGNGIFGSYARVEKDVFILR